MVPLSTYGNNIMKALVYRGPGLKALEDRPGFDNFTVVKTGRLHEIKSAIILQPGPAALTDGLTALAAIIA